MLKKESEILHLFAKEPWKRYTFTELQKAAHKKSKSYLALALKKLVTNGILIQEPVGHLPVYALNTSSTKTQVTAGFVLEHDAWNKKHIPYRDLQEAINKISVKGCIFLITGSYARNQQRDDSDIDIVIIIEDSAEPKKTIAELSHFCEMNIPPMHLYVFRNKDFLEMLLNNQFNYGKEIAKNHLILKGGQTYLKLMDEVIRHGYKG